MGLFSFLGFGKNNLKKVIKQGAIIIDVRTVHEFDQGKVPGSINIPLERIGLSIQRIKEMDKPIICCCASGNRSGNAVQILKSKGLKKVFNGGSWMSLAKLIKSM